jgi:hypothetical protein
MLLEPRAGDEEENENDNQPLFRLGEDEDIHEAFHDFA